MNTFGWKSVFWSLAIAGTVAGLHALFCWPETRCRVTVAPIKNALCLVIRSGSFWLYTLGFTVAMGSFFVYLSIAPGILIGKLKYSSLLFSFLFAMVAVVMIVTSQFVGYISQKYAVLGTLRLGMKIILAGALFMFLLSILKLHEAWVLLLPMMIIAIGIDITCAVSATGALAKFKKFAGTAVALYFCFEAIMVSVLGTTAAISFPVGSFWPIIVFSGVGSLVVLIFSAQADVSQTS